MKVVILCGGKGTRLREKTESIPKPLVEVGGKPILWHIMRYYAHYGHRDFILCLGYKREAIEEYVATDPLPGYRITCVDTGEESSKASRIMQVREHIDTEQFLVGYGDDVADVPIDKVIERHNECETTVTLTAAPLYSQFGVIEIDDNHRVQRFVEKPRLKEYWINGGFFVFNQDLFDELHRGELENEVMEYYASKGQVSSYKHDGFWKCMNTFKDCQELNALWDAGKAPWKVWEDE